MPLGQLLPPAQSSAQMLELPTFRQVPVLVPPGVAPHDVASPGGLHCEVQTPSSPRPLSMHTRSSVQSAFAMQCDHQLVSGCGGSSSPVLDSVVGLLEVEPPVSSALVEAAGPVEETSVVLPLVSELDAVPVPVPPSVSPSPSVVGARVENAPVVSSELPPEQAHTSKSRRGLRARIGRSRIAGAAASRVCGLPRGKHRARLRGCAW